MMKAGAVSHEKSRRTRERILVAAERIFAEKGFLGASMRDIMTEAGVNLSGAYYYFENKEKLLLAVFERHILPTIEREREALEKAREGANGGPIPIRQLIEAIVLPRAVGLSETAQRLVSLLLARNGTIEQKIFSSLLKLTLSHRLMFLKEFSKTCPDLSQTEVYFRFASVNALLNGFQTLAPFMKSDHSIKVPKETGIEMLITELSVLFSAPPSLPKESN